MKAVNQYIKLFGEYRGLIEAGACKSLNDARGSAFEALKEGGLPSKKTENYKYTNVEEVLKDNYGLNLQRIPLKIDPEKAFKCSVKNLHTNVFYVVNDTVAVEPTWIDTDGQAEHRILVARAADFEGMTLADGKQGMEVLQHEYNRLAKEEYDGITALNTMLVQDALVVYVPDYTHALQAIQIVNIAASTVDMMSNRRLLVVVGKESSATVLCCEEHPAGEKALGIQTTEIVTKEGTQLQFYSLEETTLSSSRLTQCYIEVMENGKVETGEMTLHNGLTRNTLCVKLRGEGASVDTCGAVIGGDTQRVDNHVLVDHMVSNCNSRMLYKYVLDDKSVGAFAGMVLVREGAQKSLSEQTNANLCIGKEAHAYSQPMLEIYADDVKCNHGSTIGKLDESALFYMQQRGVPLREAQLLLQHAFINEVLRSVSVEALRERLSEKVDERFRGKEGGCRCCDVAKQCQIEKA